MNNNVIVFIGINDLAWRYMNAEFVEMVILNLNVF